MANVTVKCYNCSKEFEIQKRIANYYKKDNLNHYCSLECKKQAKIKKVKKNCANCDKKIEVRLSELAENNFCNHSCSASFNNKKRIISENQKKKVSESLKMFHKTSEKLIVKELRKIKKQKEEANYNRKCIVCEKDIELKINSGIISKRKTCCAECASIYRSNLSKESMKKIISEGKHKGWITRNIISFPEKFFMKVLENNKINYIHNYAVKKSDLGDDSSYCYFLDFYLPNKNVDLEIDGKQHNYRNEEDLIRDNLIKPFYNIYRIKWKEIKSPQGKEYIKKEINKFLNYYNSLYM